VTVTDPEIAGAETFTDKTTLLLMYAVTEYSDAEEEVAG
jgi:hypothetical protein